MNNLDWQTLVTLACVGAAAVALLRPAVRRWRASAHQTLDKPANGADAQVARPGACGACRGCSSGGCY